MKKRSDRIAALVRLAYFRERSAARELAACRDDINRKSEKFDDLSLYHQEYTESFGSIGSTIDGGSLLNSHLFVGRIAGALEDQSSRIKSAEQRLKASKDRWMEARKRLDAMRGVHERARETERTVLNKKEQSELDEMVSQRASMILGYD